MAKRSVRSQNPKPDDTETAESVPMVEAVSPKTKRSRTATGEPAETANDGPRDSSAAAGGPSEDDIRDRAYHRYLERGGGHGMDFDDWLEAERELKKLP
ncbi:MAG TPA: DUF2934 domain-containing protein [Vicinamibacterales bacterium]|nr:DUF2934 domain-containing protein [Vicinamibacterales bacterium]